MLNEQREAIEICKEKIIKPFYDFPNPTSIELKDTEVEAIEIVLSLIKEQQAEIEKYKALYKRALSDLVKADKQIALIIDEFYKKAKIGTKCYLQKSVEKCMKYKNCKDCIKQYFANKVNSKIQ